MDKDVGTDSERLAVKVNLFSYSYNVIRKENEEVLSFTIRMVRMNTEKGENCIVLSDL